LEEARSRGAETSGIALCDALETYNIGFEEPVLPPQMPYNSYGAFRGWRSPQGDLLVGRGNLNLGWVPDNAAYGDQHGILKPRRTGGGDAQDNTAMTYTFPTTAGQRYAVIVSTASATAGNQLTLSLSGTEVSEFTFSAGTSWRQRVVPFTAAADSVTLSLVSGARADFGAVALSRGEADIYVDVAGVFEVCE
jgi:hypothetical protein